MVSNSCEVGADSADAMRNTLAGTQTKIWLIVVPSIAAICAVSFYLFPRRDGLLNPLRAPVPSRVSACKDLGPGMRRIGATSRDRYMLQFDVPVDQVRIHEDATDAPPLKYGFGIRPRNSESDLEISYGPQSNDVVIGGERAATPHIVKRIVVDDQERSVGDDDWGYLDPERRWRRVRFRGWVQAEYQFVNERDATLFDQIISSACLLPASAR